MLSVQQDKAVKSTDKIVLVAAAAGSGKTRVIVEHIKFLIKSGVDPSKIYAITYTNSAAQEMLERLDDAPVFIGTIHSLANKILRNSGINTSDWIEEQAFDKLLERINEDYYNEIELPEIEHLLVDEFQDVCDDEANFIQYSLQAKHIFVVGDSCQSIYGFKGANYHRFMDLAQNKNTTLFKLETNYRNSSSILNYANQFLKGMDDVYRINSVPANQNYGIVEEEEYNVKNIGYYISKNGNFGEWFVLARTNAQVDDILTYLRNKGIPCTTFKKSEKTYAELKDEFKNNTVKVLTIHSAKGLEANNVVVVGMKQFNAEEKRICYVACTRARERLIVMTVPEMRRGQRSKMGMYDDAAGPTINFLDAGNSAYIKGVFDRALAPSFEKHFDTFNDEDMDDGFLPDMEKLSRDFATSQYYKGYYGR